MKNGIEIAEEWRVAVACFLGAVIGSFLSLELVTQTSSGVLQGVYVLAGVLVGGVAGYLAYRFESVWSAVRKCVGVRENFLSSISFVAKYVYKRILIHALSVACLSFVFLYVFLGLMLMITLPLLAIGVASLSEGLSAIIGVTQFALFLGTFFGLVLGFFLCLAFRKEERLQEEDLIKDGTKLLVYLLPHNVLARVPGVCREGAERIRKGIGDVYDLAVIIFVTIHSELRIICFVDAAIGSAIGFVYGSVLIGGIAGAVLGYVNYRVVSVRWLKLVPTKG